MKRKNFFHLKIIFTHNILSHPVFLSFLLGKHFFFWEIEDKTLIFLSPPSCLSIKNNIVYFFAFYCLFISYKKKGGLEKFIWHVVVLLCVQFLFFKTSSNGLNSKGKALYDHHESSSKMKWIVALKSSQYYVFFRLWRNLENVCKSVNINTRDILVVRLLLFLVNFNYNKFSSRSPWRQIHPLIK